MKVHVYLTIQNEKGTERIHLCDLLEAFYTYVLIASYMAMGCHIDELLVFTKVDLQLHQGRGKLREKSIPKHRDFKKSFYTNK